MEKIRMALYGLVVYAASLATTAVVSAASASDLQTRSAEELAKYIAAGGSAVTC